MVDILNLEEGIFSPIGFRGTGVSCGLKTGGSKDISILVSETPCNTAMAFTKNRIQGAHIVIDKARITNQCNALLVNSGNANCLTGQEGVDNALYMVQLIEELLKIPVGSCLIASTGVMGLPLNMTRIKYGIERLIHVLPNETNIRHFCTGIMTTDTRQKNIAHQFKLGNDTVTIGVTAKGDSMVKPWLETMHGTLLVFISTDANISQPLLQETLSAAIEKSFNRMSIDNDLSPNDSVFLLANGMAQQQCITNQEDPRYTIFSEVLENLLITLAKQLIKQGLGVTKLVYCTVTNASTATEAEKIVRAIAESYQVKTSLFGQKTAWQKIINVIAYTSDDFDLQKLAIFLNDRVLFENGSVHTQNVVASHSDMSSIDCTLTIDLHQGTESASLWTCDLTHDYIKSNSFINE